MCVWCGINARFISSKKIVTVALNGYTDIFITLILNRQYVVCFYKRFDVWRNINRCQPSVCSNEKTMVTAYNRRTATVITLLLNKEYVCCFLLRCLYVLVGDVTSIDATFSLYYLDHDIGKPLTTGIPILLSSWYSYVKVLFLNVLMCVSRWCDVNWCQASVCINSITMSDTCLQRAYRHCNRVDTHMLICESVSLYTFWCVLFNDATSIDVNPQFVSTRSRYRTAAYNGHTDIVIALILKNNVWITNQ